MKRQGRKPGNKQGRNVWGGRPKENGHPYPVITRKENGKSSTPSLGKPTHGKKRNNLTTRNVKELQKEVGSKKNPQLKGGKGKRKKTCVLKCWGQVRKNFPRPESPG